MVRERCEFCNNSISNIQENHIIGCGNCYKYFDKEIMVEVEKIQGSSQHTGKIPRNSQEKDDGHELRKLNRALKASIESENFEKAIKYRDRIKTIINKRIDEYGEGN